MSDLYPKIFGAGIPQGKNVLVTGGAGFIGSHIVEYLLTHGVAKVRVIDNLSNGFKKNVEPFLSDPRFEFFQGDITKFEDCVKACDGMHWVSHQAALGSVPRSIANPAATHDANVNGFLNMLIAARDQNVETFVFASSSSVYGDHPALPKTEDVLGEPLSPYAVTKLVDEHYARVFARSYNMQIIGLRYFNVFGPRQDPSGPYAAAIPLFFDAALSGNPATIHGDGEQTRDFTFVANAVQANILALGSKNKSAFTKMYNVAVGERVSVNELYNLICDFAEKDLPAKYIAERPGDVKHSLADISLIKNNLSYDPGTFIKEGLKITFDWFSNRNK